MIFKICHIFVEINFNTNMTIKDPRANEVILGCISKREVASMYFPELDEKAAVNALSRTIRENTKLQEKLNADPSYKKCQRHFTPAQIETLKAHIGHPITLCNE